MPAMDTLLTTPVATAFEAFAAIGSGALYLAVGIAALAHAPRDIRSRLFFVTAIASAAPYAVTVLLWARGADSAFALPVMVLVALSLATGSLALFHFTQVFPWRRPWIRAHWKWLAAAYVLLPVPAAIGAWGVTQLFSLVSAMDASSGSGGLGAVSVGISEGLAMVGLLLVVPAGFLVGLVVPFGAVLSLYKTWLASRAAGVDRARITTYWILAGQMAGGVLAILVIPLLRLAAPTGPWVTIAAVLLFAFGLLTPIAFAAGVWKYRVLELDPDSPPAELR
jgi:hypothetical protein